MTEKHGSPTPTDGNGKRGWGQWSEHPVAVFTGLAIAALAVVLPAMTSWCSRPPVPTSSPAPTATASTAPPIVSSPGATATVSPGAPTASKVVAVLPFDVAQAVNVSARRALSDADRRSLAEHYSDVARQLLEERVVGLPGIRVVERSRLDAVIRELQLQDTLLIDAGTAAQAGRMLGARYILLGSFLDIVVAEGSGNERGTSFETTRVTSTIRVRLIETERAEVVRSWSARGSHTELRRFTPEVLMDWAVPVLSDVLEVIQRDGSFARELSA